MLTFLSDEVNSDKDYYNYPIRPILAATFSVIGIGNWMNFWRLGELLGQPNWVFSGALPDFEARGIACSKEAVFWHPGPGQEHSTATVRQQMLPINFAPAGSAARRITMTDWFLEASGCSGWNTQPLNFSCRESYPELNGWR